MKTDSQIKHEYLGLSKLFAFYLPLAGSALLVTISHVIINSTLARSTNPEVVISAYAIALSFFAVLERPVVILRQTCSALVKDIGSMKSMEKLTLLILSLVMLVSFLIAYTSVGLWVFHYLFKVPYGQMEHTVDVFQVLIWVIIFSGIRCLFHGIIISHFQTKWLTIGMIIRLIGMSVASYYYISTGVINGVSGAIIFLIGMMIECIISVIEGYKLRKKLPIQTEGSKVNGKQIFSFYRPLAYASLFATAIGPLINSMLGKSMNPTLAIDSYGWLYLIRYWSLD